MKFTAGLILMLGAICCSPLCAPGQVNQPIPNDDAALAQIDGHFSTTIRPFIDTYCISCHGHDKPEAEFDLTSFTSTAAAIKDSHHSLMMLKRIKGHEMPPKDASVQPSADARQQAVDWLQSLENYEIQHDAGDPGIVLARRLSNEEYNYTIRDLTGVDIQPTKEFPVDPSNMAGFDNSGESLVMSPSLLNKYLKAARDVADHMYLKPSGFAFAPYPMIVETDRDKFCVQQIVDFYHRQDIDYADYFQAGWRFKHRSELGKPNATLEDFAAESKISAKYLTTIFSTLEDPGIEVGPLATLQRMWRELPEPDATDPEIAQQACEDMRAYVTQARAKVEPRFLNIVAGNIKEDAQPFLIWKDVQYATHRMTFDADQLQVAGEVKPASRPTTEPGVKNTLGPGKTRLVVNTPGDPDLAVPAGGRARFEAAFARFCSVFPDKFYMQERGRNYFDTTKDRGRYLSAGFHNTLGYFRDDAPLYQLMLDDHQQKELDELWHELDFVASANIRSYAQFYHSDEARASVEGHGVQIDPLAVKDITSEKSIMALRDHILGLVPPGNPSATDAVNIFFARANDSIRWVEQARLDAEPTHLQALVDFAARADRRPLTPDEKQDLLNFYRACRDKDGLDHEAALREAIVSVLMSPDMDYRVDLVAADKEIHPLSDYALASRLSYFLWSSVPDDQLLAHAAAGDLHNPGILIAQARRMLKDPRISALAVEFGGNWLDFRRFQDLNTVDRDRFASFTPDLRDAMFEEPVRFLMDLFQKNRSVLDCLYAHDTFVNPVLAKHYGMPVPDGDANEWVHIEDASSFDRGGILPMAIFLTKNAPGLRTSPVKRGNWVVKNVLGERIPPPPPVVPELPRDEAKMDLPVRDLLARHRADPSCAGCHVHFDSLGLVFEGFGPIGEERKVDLAGRPVDASATFPDGSDGAGLAGLRQYIHDRRQADYVDNLCGKLLAYALNRSLIMSDDIMIQQMHNKLATDDFKFDDLIDIIVTSNQFLTKRGGESSVDR